MHLGGGGGELGDGLGALRDGVLGELTGQDEAHSGLDLSGGEGGLLVVTGELAGLSHDALEDVADEGVHDGHGLLADTNLCTQGRKGRKRKARKSNVQSLQRDCQGVF